MKKFFGILIMLSLFNFTINSEEIKKINLEEDSIDIKEKKFSTDIFWTILPWKDNTSITIDGWGKYSVLSFDKKGKLKQKTLCDYPKKQYDRIFFADDKTGFIYANESMMVHLYNAKTKIENSFVPVLSWRGYSTLFPLNEKEILVQFVFDNGNGFFTYTHSSNKFENTEITDIRDFKLIEQFYDNKYKFLAKENGEYFLYDWEKQSKENNKLTEFFNKNKINSYKFNMKNNRAFVSNENEKFIIFWNNDFSEFETYNLNDYLSSDSYSINVRSFSGDGKYGFATIYEYDRYYGCGLYHWTFIDFDKFKENKENPIKPTMFITDRTNSMFTTGFVFGEKKGWGFIFTDETSKAYAIFMKDLF